MKHITMKQALDLEGITMPAQHSYYQSEQAVKAAGWAQVRVALRVGRGEKIHGGRALQKGDNLVITDGVYCGARRHWAGTGFVGIDTPVTCEKCISRGY